MSRDRSHAFAAVLGLALLTNFSSLPSPMVTVAHADGPQPSTLPGQPGGDPAPDTKEAQSLLLRGRYDDAITATKRALGRDERYVPAMIVMAKAYYYLRKYELATAIVDIAKGIDANNAEAFNLLGFIAIANNDKISATAAFQKATDFKADYAVAWNNLAAQFCASKNYDGAITAGEKATQLAPMFAKAWLNLGSAYRGKNRYEDAERSYRKALDLNPNYASAYFNLGILYLDAPQMPNLDLVAKLNTAISHFSKYRNLAGAQLAKDDPADGYVEDAQKAIERERKRLERAAKQKDRDKAKAAAAPASNGAAPVSPSPNAPADPSAPPAATPGAP